MDIKLKLKNYSALAWPKGNGTSRNLGRAYNDDDDDDDNNNKVFIKNSLRKQMCNNLHGNIMNKGKQILVTSKKTSEYWLRPFHVAHKPSYSKPVMLTIKTFNSKL